jgi:hypothetical protein
MSDAKTIAKEHGLTLADVAELIAPPKPRKWADLDDRTDEVRAALDLEHLRPVRTPPRWRATRSPPSRTWHPRRSAN